MPRINKSGYPGIKNLSPSFLKYVLGLVMAVVFAMPSHSRDILLDWTPVVERPASGTMSVEPISWRNDSALTMQVRYGKTAATPTAMYSAKVVAPLKQLHRFSAYVNITRAEAEATLRITDAARTQLASVSVSTKSGSEGALVPGIWTPVVLEADLAALAEGHDLSSIYIDILPQWDGDKAVPSDAAPLIMIEDAWLDVLRKNNYLSEEVIKNSRLEDWVSPDNSSLSFPSEWASTSSRPDVGAHLTDFGAKIAKSSTIKTPLNSLYIPGNNFEAYDHLAFKAKAEPGTTITIFLEDTKHSTHNHTQTVTVEDGRWNEYLVDMYYAWSMVTFSADNTLYIDDCRLVNIYDYEMSADKLYVTSSADSGEGSLRQVVANAPDYSTIVLKVDDVYLESPVVFGEKSLSIEKYSSNKAIIHSPKNAAAFEIRPSKKNLRLEFSYITLKSSDGASVTNGGAVTVPDSRGTVEASLKFTGVTFDNFKVTSSGGAVYLNDPSVTTEFKDCTFNGCQASNGAAIAFAKGKHLEVLGCLIADCTSTGSTGGAVSITADGSATAGINWTRFINCESTSSTGGTGGVAMQSQTAKVSLCRSLFDHCSGGRACGISAYNGTRGAVTSTIDMTHCTVVNSSDRSPAVAVTSSGSYEAPKATLVNSILTHNGGVDLVAPATLESSHNIVTNTEVALNNPIGVKENEKVFGEYDEQGNPAFSDYFKDMLINYWGPAYDAGINSFVTSDGREVIPEVSMEFDMLSFTWHELSFITDHLIRSIGHTETYNYKVGVDDVTVDSDSVMPVSIFPNPATTTLNVRGDFEKMWISSLNGATVYVGTGSTANISTLATGEYVASFKVNGKVYSIKFIKK